jgi:hypothetical protein
MLRVVLGRARSDTEWSGKISGLQFDSAPEVQERARSRGVTSTILTVPRSQQGEVVDLEANGDSDSERKTEPLDAAEGMDGTKEEKART